MNKSNGGIWPVRIAGLIPSSTPSLTLTEAFEKNIDEIQNPPDLNKPLGEDRSLTVNRIKLKNDSDDTDIMITGLIYNFIGTDQKVDDFLEMDVNAFLFEDLDCDGVEDDLISLPTPIKGTENFGFDLVDKVIKPGEDTCFDLQYDIFQESPLCKKFGARITPDDIIATFIDPTTNEETDIDDVSGSLVEGTIVIRNFGEECPFIVNSVVLGLDDEDFLTKDIDNGDGICDTGNTVTLANGEVVPECILSAAIQEANAFTGKDKISFDDLDINIIVINNSDPQLPDITDPVIIDGTTHPSGMVSLLIRKDNTEGLVITGGDSTVKGMNILNETGHGIVLRGNGFNVIQGNFIGAVTTSESSTLKNGIFIDNSAQNKIGGTSDVERNVIAGCKEDGIEIKGSGSQNNIVSGNFIGTGVDGKEINDSFMNENVGVLINNAPDNIIKNNVISNNRLAGIKITGIDATGNKTQGNIIGTSVDFDKESFPPALGNTLDGVRIGDNASNNSIGGVINEEGNVIVFNGIGGGAGVAVDSGTGNTIRLNSILFNADNEIDLGADGRTENDEGDFDTGPNQLKNFPVIESADFSGGLITIKGSVDDDEFVDITVDFYLANSKAISQGMHIGVISAKPLTAGFPGSFEAVLPLNKNMFDEENSNLVLSTATDPDGNTSEYSEVVEIKTLQDIDGDGVGDEIEDKIGDGNNDGIPDSEQTIVTSLKNLNDKPVTIEAPPGTVLKDVMVVEIPSPESVPQGVEIDSGGCYEYKFNTDGTIAKKINLRLQELTETNILYNFGKTPDNTEDHWYEFDFDGNTGSEILEGENNDSMSFTIKYVDGQRGDDDLEENDVIITLGCPATKKETEPGDDTSKIVQQIIDDIENVRKKEDKAGIAVVAENNADAINLLNESQEDLEKIRGALADLRKSSMTSKEKRAAGRAGLAIRLAIVDDLSAVSALERERPSDTVIENIEQADIQKEQAISILKEGFGIE